MGEDARVHNRRLKRPVSPARDNDDSSAFACAEFSRTVEERVSHLERALRRQVAIDGTESMVP
jgi:hypothetical protein